MSETLETQSYNEGFIAFMRGLPREAPAEYATLSTARMWWFKGWDAAKETFGE